MIFNSAYQTVDLEIEVTEEEYREWYIPRALRSFFCYSPARSRCEPGACHCGERMDMPITTLRI
jgi:hypothetical protein